MSTITEGVLGLDVYLMSQGLLCPFRLNTTKVSPVGLYGSQEILNNIVKKKNALFIQKV